MPPDEEVRVVSSTGGEKGQKSQRLGGADPLALEELGLVYGFGESKYARFNYLKGYDWSLSVDAIYRHFLAFQRGEDRDPESGLLHMAHVSWHGLGLTSFQLRAVGNDDRPLTFASRKGTPILADDPVCSRCRNRRSDNLHLPREECPYGGRCYGAHHDFKP